MGFLGIGDRKTNEWNEVTKTQEKTDWTHFLSAEAANLLRSVLEAAYKHREAYFKADDIKNAQLWSALIEQQREIAELRAKIESMTPKTTSTMKLGTADDSVVLNKIKAVMQPTVEDSKEATDALVDSLMKF